jgi:hypothetical protein
MPTPFCVFSSSGVPRGARCKYLLQDVLHSSNVLLLLQNLITVIALLLLKVVGAIHSDSITPSPTVLLASPTFHYDLIIGVLYAFNVMFGFWSLKFLTIPVFGTLKRSVVVIVWVAEYFVLHTPGAVQCLPPLFCMFIGTVIASVFDLYFVPLGYLFAMASSFAQAAAFVVSKKASSIRCKTQSVSDKVLGGVFFNSLVSITLLCLIILYVDVTPSWSALTQGDPSWVTFSVLLNGLSILALNYSIFMNCTLNSPLSHAISGNMKTILTTALGVLFFHKPTSPLGAAGIVLNIAGALWYSAVKYLQCVNRPKTYDL